MKRRERVVAAKSPVLIPSDLADRVEAGLGDEEQAVIGQELRRLIDGLEGLLGTRDELGRDVVLRHPPVAVVVSEIHEKPDGGFPSLVSAQGAQLGEGSIRPEAAKCTRVA